MLKEHEKQSILMLIEVIEAEIEAEQDVGPMSASYLIDSEQALATIREIIQGDLGG